MPLDKTEMFSFWLAVSHSQSEFSPAFSGVPLPPFLCRDTWPWEWEMGHRSTCAASGTGFVLVKPQWQNEAGSCSCSVSDDPSTSPKQEWCCILAGVGYVLIGLSTETPTVGNETRHASTKMCHLDNCFISVVFSFQCSGRIVKMSYSSHFIGHQSRQGIVKDSKKTLQLLCVPGETK